MARRRLAFEEFFQFSAGLALLRAGRSQRQVEPYVPVDLTPLTNRLPFRLTGAQQRAIREIQGDLMEGHPMNRLLQGDVGSGKTVVAAAAAWYAVGNRRQVALMAPTEILAEQHFRFLTKLLTSLGVRCVLLTGSMTAGEKREARQALASGAADLAVGTHALLSDTTAFARLGLVITDEQHRFGVAQRAALGEKGDTPHLLVMSATPIPRTLALMLYGDLDVSVLDELPPGTAEIGTFLVNESYRARLNGFLRQQAQAGRQCYVVCPAVEEGESGKSAEGWAATLQTRVFPDLSVGLIHGKMKGAEKEAVMGRFARGEISILVATTVIEVGVDVPNATVMVVEDGRPLRPEPAPPAPWPGGPGPGKELVHPGFQQPEPGDGRPPENLVPHGRWLCHRPGGPGAAGTGGLFGPAAARPAGIPHRRDGRGYHRFTAGPGCRHPVD